MVFKVLLALLFSFGLVAAIGAAIFAATHCYNEDDVSKAQKNLETAKARKYSAAEIADFEENLADIEKGYHKGQRFFAISIIVAIIWMVLLMILILIGKHLLWHQGNLKF